MLTLAYCTRHKAHAYSQYKIDPIQKIETAEFGGISEETTFWLSFTQQ